MKYILSVILALAAFSPFAHAEPLAIDQPIIIFTQEEFKSMMDEVKKLYNEYKTLEAAKSCKKT